MDIGKRILEAAKCREISLIESKIEKNTEKIHLGWGPAESISAK
jgi:hypothetical protein